MEDCAGIQKLVPRLVPNQLLAGNNKATNQTERDMKQCIRNVMEHNEQPAACAQKAKNYRRKVKELCRVFVIGANEIDEGSGTHARILAVWD